MSGEVQDFGTRDTDAVTREKHSALDNTPLQTSRHNPDQAQLVTSAVGRVCCHGNTQPDNAALRPADDTVSIMLRPVRIVRRLQSKRGSTCLVITVHREQYTYRHRPQTTTQAKGKAYMNAVPPPHTSIGCARNTRQSWIACTIPTGRKYSLTKQTPHGAAFQPIHHQRP